jgi:hypothetical protein
MEAGEAGELPHTGTEARDILQVKCFGLFY